MVKEKVEFDVDKMADIQKDVIHFERLIGDLIGILSKSISFCIHSGESINELVNRLTRNCEAMNDKNGDDPSIIIQESSFLSKNDLNMNNNDNGIDYIRFTSNGPVYSLPKRITNSLVGSFLYEYSQEDIKTVDGTIYLDYHGDETVAPLLIDSLMNKKMNVDKLKLGDQLELLDLFEYCNLPIPEELMKTYYRRDYTIKKYKEDDDVVLYINDKKDDVLTSYLKKNGLWTKIINEYGSGYVDYDEENNERFMKMNYKYDDYIDYFARNECLFIDDKNNEIMNNKVLENEMYSLFGVEGKEALKIDMNGKPIVFADSKIINKKYYETPLVNWLGKEKKWKLLFRASEHDYSSSEFHRYCDNKGETVTLIKHIGHNIHINIFGGYTNVSWKNSGRWISYSKEFLFTLSNEYNIPPTKYLHNGDGYGIYCNSSFGPSFGGGYECEWSDIAIKDDCHYNTDSWVRAYSFTHYYTPQKSSLFVNTNDDDCLNNFKVEDYEVWGRV
ncbi:hypothetical protein WA158_001334 [Blastocystis sp. Blastoise]